MPKNIIYFIFAFLSIAFVSSCKYLETRPRDETLVALLNFNVSDLDPINTNDNESSTILSAIYEGLFKYDLSMTPIPSIAESWEVDSDIHYKIHIKKGILFHNGDEVKASDVKFSLKRACESEGMFYLFRNIDKDSITIIDSYTLQFSLFHPDATILMTLCHTAASIVSEVAAKKRVNKKSSISLQPIGTGPFQLEKIEEGEIILKRFDEYHGDAPYFKFMKFKLGGSYSKRISSLESGDVDIVCSLNIYEVERCKKNPDLKVLTTEGLSIEYLGMNMKKNPLDDIRVRRAIEKGLDIDLINRVTSNGIYTTATSPCAPDIIYSIANKRRVKKRDVEGAKSLLFEAGYGNGLNLTFLVAESFERMEMAGKIKEQLWRIGINLEMEVVDWDNFLEKLEAGEAELFLMGSAPDFPDPDSVLRDSFISTSPYENGNYFGCADEELDALLMEGISTVDTTVRKSIYEKAQLRVLELVPCIFIYYEQLNLAIKRHYEGVRMNPLGYPFLAYTHPSIISED